MDESGEIRATGFNDAVDRFYPILQENKVYFISKAKVTIAKKQFSTLPNEYEISLESGSEIEECAEAGDVPEVKYNFVPIKSSIRSNRTTRRMSLPFWTATLMYPRSYQRPRSVLLRSVNCH